MSSSSTPHSRIFSDHAAGDSIKTIAKRLNAEHVATPSPHRVQRERPKSEWVVSQAPHLQIVLDELWGAVERRLATVNASFACGPSPGLCSRSFSAQYLLSDFLKCGICEAKMVVVSGRGQSGRARYGCPMKHARGICANNMHLRQGTLEREIIGGLLGRVLREDVSAYAFPEFKRPQR